MSIDYFAGLDSPDLSNDEIDRHLAEREGAQHTNGHCSRSQLPQLIVDEADPTATATALSFVALGR